MANETAFRPITVKKAERKALKEKLVRLQKEWMRIRQASPDSSDRILGLSNFCEKSSQSPKDSLTASNKARTIGVVDVLQLCSRAEGR